MSSETKAANPGKKKEGFLKRQAKQARNSEMLSEDELLQRKIITPDDILKLSRCTESKDSRCLYFWCFRRLLLPFVSWLQLV